MEIRRVEYSRIYGKLTGSLKFENGENFIVGINGCGKTTIIKLIYWVLAPSFQDLCTLDHERIKVTLKHKNLIYHVISEIKQQKHRLSVLTGSKSRKFHPIETQLLVDPRNVESAGLLRDTKPMYEHLQPEEDEVETYNFLLTELPSPVFVGLDRAVENRIPITPPSVARQRKSNNLTAIDFASELMRDSYNSGRRELMRLNNKLNNKVLELSFSGVIKKGSTRTKTPVKDFEEAIAQLLQRMNNLDTSSKYTGTLSHPQVKSAFLRYLSELKSVLDYDDKDYVWYAINTKNFERAKIMFEMFEEHETSALQVQKEIINFTDVTNSFLSDSRKKLQFNENTGVPFFSYENSSEKLDLNTLSSGEAQIIVLLSYFAFLAKRGVPIIIDEPEISLHVKWQADFVHAVKKVMPADCQTIMATHSPEICGAKGVNVQPIRIGVQK